MLQTLGSSFSVGLDANFEVGRGPGQRQFGAYCMLLLTRISQNKLLRTVFAEYLDSYMQCVLGRGGGVVGSLYLASRLFYRFASSAKFGRDGLAAGIPDHARGVLPKPVTHQARVSVWRSGMVHTREAPTHKQFLLLPPPSRLTQAAFDPSKSPRVNRKLVSL